MFVTPNYKIESDSDVNMVSFSENEEGIVDAYYETESNNLIKKKIQSPDKLLLASISEERGLYLLKNGKIEIDYLIN